jgi:hypothetical protein
VNGVTTRKGKKAKGEGREGHGKHPTREAPAGADRARGMVMVDPWGALLAGLLEMPEEDAGAGEKVRGRGRGER